MFYRGKIGQWSWILHRLTGVAVLIFLFAHILDTFLIGWGPDLFNKVMKLYSHPFFRVNEIFLFAAVLYHALNGVRIIVIDFCPSATKYHERIFIICMILFAAIMLPVTFLMARHIFH